MACELLHEASGLEHAREREHTIPTILKDVQRHANSLAAGPLKVHAPGLHGWRELC